MKGGGDDPQSSANWWLLVLRGVLGIAFGVLVFLWPMLAWVVIVASFAAYALLDGVFAISAAILGHPQRRHWWGLILEGILGIAAAVVTLLWPTLATIPLLAIIAAWAIATGVAEVIVAIRLRRELAGEWLLALSGVLSVLFGITLILQPQAGAIAIAWLIGVYSIAFGFLLLVLGFRLREFVQHRTRRASVPT